MATSALEITPFPIPERAPAPRDTDDALVARLMLAERIADLANIKTEEEPTQIPPWSVNVYVKPPAASLRKQRPGALLCTISHDAIIVCGLGERFRNFVIERGWASGGADGTRLLMPRNIDELKVCWKIIRHAYKRLADAAATAAPIRTKGWPDNLPRFSRTTLQ